MVGLGRGAEERGEKRAEKRAEERPTSNIQRPIMNGRHCRGLVRIMNDELRKSHLASHVSHLAFLTKNLE